MVMAKLLLGIAFSTLLLIAVCSVEQMSPQQKFQERAGSPALEQHRGLHESTCSNGLVGIGGSNTNGDVCCPLGCGDLCGGSGCGGRGQPEFDSTYCCINGILNNQRDCSISGAAPCIITDDVLQPVDSCLNEGAVQEHWVEGKVEVDLSGCSLTDADHGDIATFLDSVGRSTIASLELSNNDLTSLKEDLLDGMTFLLYFYVNDNALETFPADIFQGSNLKFLEATNNNLVSLPTGVFNGMVLTSLKITGNALECLPEVGKWPVSYTVAVDPGTKDCRYLNCDGDTLRIGDSYCTATNNNENCEWDGGDCCKCNCEGYGCRLYYKHPLPVTCANPESACQDVFE